MSETNEGKKKKNWLLIIIILLLLLIIAGLVIFIIFNSKHEVTINTNGGNEVEVIVKDNVLEVPPAPKKEGYKFAGWQNEKYQVIVSKIKIKKDTHLSAMWIEEDTPTVVVTYEVVEDEKYELTVEDDSKLVLPAEPYRKGYIFLGWFDLDGHIVSKDMIISDEITLIAKWVKDGAKTHKLSFDTNGGVELPTVYILEDGTLVFPVTPVKEGYVFAGWYDQNDKLVEKDTKITSDTKLIAKWVVEYSCPDNCEVSKDGKSCTIFETANVTKKTSCPSGTESVEYFCTKKATGDGWSSPAISCKGNKTGYCVKSSSKGYDLYNYSTNSCPSGYLEYSFAEHSGAMMGCLKKYNKVQADSCPNGYKKDGNKCKKTTTKSCTKNVAKEY